MNDEGLDAKAQNVLNVCNLLRCVVEKDYGTLDIVEKVKIAKHLDGVLADFIRSLPGFDEEEVDDLLSGYRISIDNEGKVSLQEYFARQREKRRFDIS